MKSSKHTTPVGGEREPMGIGALAERFGLATHVLRHWEATGLLAPARDDAGRRRYGSSRPHTRRRHPARQRGRTPLGIIRSLVAAADPAKRGDILREEAEMLRSRIAAAQASLGMIECALGCDHEDFSQCAHFRQMVADRIGTDAAVRLPA